ncbi:Histidyl-tRNA synthetase [Olavius algarvensis spirochete endosymbiont]|uniref:histidine--tRNA ligase n=1 Tax=Olavius algarvensis spirochete endosymbiont TaxID=260710 RepID=UPI00052E0B0C|nr:histidine--tRNA ligase [Olavius algarvensis spirochete endosymbiont]KGM38811.1 hypothetical protein JY97_14595 [Alkalispirochaeta odontotermitis]VDB00817.1 Histidyl-tRNA synthetase [Olavius algarvensis spirochete endosymbiont]
MAGTVKARVLKGFRDSLPREELRRGQLIRLLEEHFRFHGYMPIDTPALEYADILLSKMGGETDKQSYRFTDGGGRDVALRFDLTVPLARFVASNRSELTLPFRPYHVGKVWRGENTQRGRFREFIQCDFDLVGSDSVGADLEIMLMTLDGLDVIDAGPVRIRFNHRGLFNLLLDGLDVAGSHISVLRSVDKTRKIGSEGVRTTLTDLVGRNKADAILDFIAPETDNEKTLEKMLQHIERVNREKLAKTPETMKQSSNIGKQEAAGLPETMRVRMILNAFNKLGLGDILLLDPSITRGLDYYTGIVFEVFLERLPDMGSVCSGGRYNDLTGLFLKESISGVGASIGLDRLLAGLDELGIVKSTEKDTDLLVLMLDESLLGDYQCFARDFRRLGLAVEVYPEQRKLEAQFRYAQARGISFALLYGAHEAKNRRINLKDLKTRKSFENLSISAAKAKLVDLLDR